MRSPYGLLYDGLFCARRNFLSGTIYAIGGHLEKLGGGIFLATPNNVSIEGTYSDDTKPEKVHSSKKTDDDSEDDFF